MLPTPVQIKDKLLKQLDDKNNVDETTVVEMVSILEKSQVTRVTLEETKIGKVVNDLRRKIKNEKLAKRLKQLVRNWKTILDQAVPANGSARPTTLHAKLQSSLSVSPALSAPSGTSRLVSPAQPRSKPNTPVLLSQQTASPVLLGKKSTLVARNRGVSPGLAEYQSSPLAAQRVTSPVSSTVHPRTPLTSSRTGRVASPLVPGRVASPAVPGRVASPAVPGHVASPAVPGRVASPAVPGRVASPAVPGGVASPAVSDHVASQGISSRTALRLFKDQHSPQVLASLNRSPALQVASGTENDVSASRTDLLQGKKAVVGENSKLGGRLTPTSFASENSQDRLSGVVDNGRLDSDNESSCSSSWNGQSRYNFPLKHSNDGSVSNLNNKNCVKDQRELSKTNIANRKRAREKSKSPPVVDKMLKLESSGLSALGSHSSGKATNGHVTKSRKKDLSRGDVPQNNSPSLFSVHKSVSSPFLSVAVSDNLASYPQSDLLLRQESSDSRFSALSFDRPARDKHKVKTTEQLIEALQQKSNSASVGNRIMTKLRTNQIEKEEDIMESVLPAGIKPRGKRGRRKNEDINVSVPSSDLMLSRVKNELVERFLETSEPSPLIDEYNPFKDDQLPSPVPSVLEPKLQLGACSSSFSKDSFEDSFSGRRQDHPDSAPKDESSMDAISPPIPSTSQGERTGSALTLNEIYSQLPPVDSNIDWDNVDFFEVPEQTPVTEKFVDLLHSDHLPGINGLFDINRDWTSWQQTITLPSFEGDQLHILPYVDLDN